MKNKFYLSTALLLSTNLAFADNAKVDMQRVIEGALNTMPLASQPQEQEIDINKINKIFDDAMNKVLPEFADWIEVANVHIDAKTFSLDALRLDADANFRIKKSLWSAQPTDLTFALGSRVITEEQAERLSVSIGAALKTQVLELVKFGARKILEENPIEEGEEESPSDSLARTLMGDLLNSQSMDAAYTKILQFRDDVLASQDPSFDSAKEFFNEVQLSTVGGEFIAQMKPLEFYGVRLSFKLVSTSDFVSFKFSGVDIGNNLKEQIDEHKAEIKQALIEIQNVTDEQMVDVEEGIRGLLNAAKALVLGDEAE